MKTTWEINTSDRYYYFRVEDGQVMVADYRPSDNPHTHTAGFMKPIDFMNQYGEIFEDLFGEKEFLNLQKLLKDPDFKS